MAREKRKNSEKRKEKSRDAARCRRSKETEIFTELAECLPLQENILQHLDKASVMRLAISQLKIGDVLDAVGIADDKGRGYSSEDDDDKDLRITDGEDQLASALPKGPTNQLYLKGLEGTVIILSHDGDFVYLSENVVKYLGLQQIEMMGQSIYDYIHPCDHEEIKKALNVKTANGWDHQQNGDAPSSLVYSEARTFSIRMKCTLTTKGRSVNLKSAPYKVMKCAGRLVIGGDRHDNGHHSDGSQTPSPSSSPSSTSSSTTSTHPSLPKPYLLAVIEPIPHPSNIEVPLDSSTFLSKHEMDMSFVFCDDRIEELAGYDPTAMVGQSYFDFHHALDSENIRKTFKDLYAKGQAMTPAYRLLVANGGYIWVITQATAINSNRNQKPQSIVCVHFVLSGVEERGVILSSLQEQLAMSAWTSSGALTPNTPTTPLLVTAKTEMMSPMPSTPNPLTPPMTNSLLLDDILDIPTPEPLKLDLLPPKLELSTESIFAPKTKDMEKALCRPPDLVPYLTEDPDDLSCLSPTAGDDILPLPFSNTVNKPTDFLLSPMTSPMLPMAKSPQAMMGQTSLLSPGQMSGGAVSSDDCSRPSSPVDYLSCVTPFELDPVDKFFAPVECNTNLCGDNNVTPAVSPMYNSNNLDTAQQQQQQQQLPPQMANDDGATIVVQTKQEELDEEDIMGIDFAMRAPYIPMDADQDHDLLPTSSSTLFNLSKDDFNPSVFGRTEYVFGPKETLFEEPKPMPKRSLRDMLGESPVVASIEQPAETTYLQMKRPLDMNCLEKGPPAPKMSRLNESAGTGSSVPVQPCQRRGVHSVKTAVNKNSVLLNLLLTGEDISSGYKVNQKGIISRNNAKANVREASRFDTLTRQDCEVNAPTQCGKLLQGQELFSALDL